MAGFDFQIPSAKQTKALVETAQMRMRVIFEGEAIEFGKPDDLTVICFRR